MRQYLFILPFSFFVFPALAFAALININTADETTLETLPGIGPSKAAAIISYRDTNGPFATIEDIQLVSGIGPSTFANIEPLITVGDTAPAATDTGTTSTTASPPASSGGAATYVPPPTAIALDVQGPATVPLEVPVEFSARVTTRSGAIDPNARIIWSFGDGSSAEGTVVEKLYHYAGTYAVVATAADGSATASGEFTVVARSVQVRITSISGAGITIANDAATELDLSGWKLVSGFGTFRIPSGMHILPGMSVLVPFSVTDLPVSFDVSLTYPDGITAARYAPAPKVKLNAGTTSIKEVRATEASNIVSVSSRAYANPRVVAPREPADTSNSRGALFATSAAPVASSTNVAAVAASGSAAGLLASPWTYGLLGVIAVAGAAFVLL